MKTLMGSLAALLFLIGLDAQAVNGPETAQLLNNRYQATTSTCAADKPAWYCNGVLVQAEPLAAEQKFWQHGAQSSALGAESLIYLRRDLSIHETGKANGVVFSDLFTAAGDGKLLEVLCAYPFAAVLGASRTDAGCALPTGAQPSLAGVGSCAAVGVTDTRSWVEHFQQTGNQVQQQCSLSALDPVQFAVSLTAHESLGNEWSSRTNQLQVKNWDDSAPDSIPVQALFYDASKTGALMAAQQDQRDFFDATGHWLPILRLDLNNSSGKVFGFNLQDQLYVGYQVAARLNARYADTRAECQGGQPSYYCNGVLFRSTEATSAFHAWNPSPGSTQNNGVSFSYARQGVTINQLVYSRPFGFTFKESAAPVVYPATVRCAYPYDAGTSGSPDPCTFHGACEALGVNSVALWMAQYAGNPGRGCAFEGASAAQFQLSMDVRREFPEREDWNEIMVAAWPQDIPSQLPLEALFYQFGSTGLAHAQFIQNDYFQQTQRFLPVVAMNLAAADGTIFTYIPADQLAPGTPSSRASGEHHDSALNSPTVDE
jgi:hypothetical protein